MDYPYFLSGLMIFIAPPLIIMLMSKFGKTPRKKTATWQYVFVFCFMSLLMLSGLHDDKVTIVIIGFFFYLYAYAKERKGFS